MGINLIVLNLYLIRDIAFQNIPYKFSDTNNSHAILNKYCFSLVNIL